MTSFVWVPKEVVLAVHDRSIAVHGGGTGIRDQGLLDSALARPQNLEAYDEPDVFALAAAYAAGIVSSHPFIDGNKRTGFMTAYIFLRRNGWQLTAPEAEATRVMLDLAASEISEQKLALWFRESCSRAES